MATMLKEFVLETLTHSHISRINFQYGRMRVYPSGYQNDIASAVRSGRIQFDTGRDAHYAADTPPGEVHRMAVPQNMVSMDAQRGELVVQRNLGQQEAELRGTILHEATHALQDYQRIQLDPRTSEGAAYLAAWLARLLWGYPRLGPGANIRTSAHSYARHLAGQLLDRQIVYVVPDNDVLELNALVTTGSAHRYVFNGI